MTIEVIEKENGSFDISWDENDPVESIMNTWTEQDFIDAIVKQLDEFKEDDRGTESITRINNRRT